MVCVFCAAVTAFEGRAEGAAAWSYHEKNYEIYTPQLSPDNNKLLFVRKLHAPDGHEAELYSKEELQRIRSRVQANNRIEDPEIVLMDVSAKNARRIDYGWNPIFSSDQRKIAYAHQKKPISGYRVLAAAQAGNEICEYDLTLQKSATAASPAAGYLSKPVYGRNGMLAFALSDAVNGAWGGDIGVGSADPATGSQKVHYAPAKEHDLYHLVLQFAPNGDTYGVLRMRLLTGGTYLADSYAYELVDAQSGALLYDWGAGDISKAGSIGFRMCPSGPEVYDKSWRPLAQSAASAKTQSAAAAKARAPGKAEEKTQEQAAGASSPDCVYTATHTEREVTLLAARGGAKRRWAAPKGEIQSVTWAPDSSRIVLVISHGVNFGEKFTFDEVVILPVSTIHIVQ